MNKERYIRIFGLWAVMLFATMLCLGCADDLFVDDSGHIPEGEATVECNIVFEPLHETRTGNGTRATNAPDGKAISELRDVCILFYNKDSVLIDNGLFEVKKESFLDDTETDVDRDKVDGKAEEKTRRVKLKLQNVPYGEYYVFAVANLGLSDGSTTTRSVLDSYEDKYKTIKGLKALELTWDNKEILNNAEMLGYFTEGSEPGTPKGINDAGTVKLNKADITLHSWLRRAASKLTLEFDPSGLRNNVRIYVKSARLHHIPLHCPLGDKNTPAKNEELVDEKNETSDSYYHLDYYPEGMGDYDNYEKWMVLTRGGILQGEPLVKVTEYVGMHTENAKALYFYENMQGTGKDKSQDANGDGELDIPGKNTDPKDEGYKDKKPYGTYLEVEAYYVSNAPDNYGKGKIIYRFMLGNDINTNYDAERNHHYKVTMRFRGNANDVDWHIDYDPEPDILYAPDPYYISYSYNSSMNLPLYFSGELKKGDYVEVKIVENGWGPADPDKLQELYGSCLPLDNSIGEDKGLWNGFLALAKPENTNLLPPSTNQGVYTTYNKVYWKDHPEIGKRTIEYATLKEAVEADGAFNLTLWTRQMNLVAASSFTGNNIFPQYKRKAVIEISGKIGGAIVDAKKITIYQVERIINPSGVFRSHDNDAEFEVIVTYRNGYSSLRNFHPLTSIGPWEASVICGDGWEIVGAKDRNGKKIVSGDDGSEMRFQIKPTGIIDKTECKTAIVEVLYNNFTCSHKIILRQGDEPIALVQGGRKWYYYNLESKNSFVSQPMDEGSMFRFGNIDDAISSSNFTEVGSHDMNLNIVGQDETKVWTDIVPNQNGFSEVLNIGGRKAVVAECTDFYALYKNAKMEFKFGILYGNSATETLMNAEEAMSYFKSSDKFSDPKCGMRGCFAYNSGDGRSIFFPVGNTGMGRLKDGPNENEGTRRGVLRYSNRSDLKKYEYGKWNPLFVDIDEQEGAIYYFRYGNNYETTSDGLQLTNEIRNNNNNNGKDYDKEVAWDINFRTLNFATFGKNAYNGNWEEGKSLIDAQVKTFDGAYIRCVVPDNSETDTPSAAPKRKKR